MDKENTVPDLTQDRKIPVLTCQDYNSGVKREQESTVLNKNFDNYCA